MTIPEKAAQWAVGVANNNSHGYDQANRWGPDYDCSSLVISAYKAAGVPLSATYTGNMRSDMMQHGFAIPINVNLATGAGLQTGDVLLHEKNHTAIYVGDGKIVQARTNEAGGVTGGKPGDQGNEITISPYYNYPWDYCLRYVAKDTNVPVNDVTDTNVGDKNVYVVKSGDSLWRIAQDLLGDPWRYTEIMKANNLASDRIYAGQRLVIPNVETPKPPERVALVCDVDPETMQLLNIMADGNNITIGQVIDKLLEDAR